MPHGNRKGPVIKLDIGCGTAKKPGFVGIDAIAFAGVDHGVRLGVKPWVTEIKAGDAVPDYLEAHDESAGRYRFKDNVVEEAHCSHVIEHLTNFNDKWERVHFFNELYRVMAPGAKCQLIWPHWCSSRYYGDPTHGESMSEFAMYYLLREWRLGNPAKGLAANAPHTDASFVPGMYDCDFDAAGGYSFHPALLSRNQDYQSFAIQWYKEAAQDCVMVLTKRPPA